MLNFYDRQHFHLQSIYFLFFRAIGNGNLDHATSSNRGRVIWITQPPPTEVAWSALFSNLSKSALDNYVEKRSERPLLEDGGCVIPASLRHVADMPIALTSFGLMSSYTFVVFIRDQNPIHPSHSSTTALCDRFRLSLNSKTFLI